MVDVYVINMAKDVVKRQHMSVVCSGLQNVSFIDAVVGADLSKEEIERVYIESEAIDAIGRPLSRGEIGCFLSHKKAYINLLSGSEDAALVLEDDVQLSVGIVSIISEVVEIKNWDIILLGHHGRSSRSTNTLVGLWGRKRLSNGRQLARPCERVMGTYGYVVSRQGAAKMLASMARIARPIDHLTGDSQRLNIYCVVEPVVTIDEAMSNDHHAMHERVQLKAKKNLIAASRPRSFLVRMAGFIGRISGRCTETIRVFLPK